MPHFVPAEAGKGKKAAGCLVLVRWPLFPSSKPIVLEGGTRSGLFATHFLPVTCLFSKKGHLSLGVSLTHLSSLSGAFSSLKTALWD